MAVKKEKKIKELLEIPAENLERQFESLEDFIGQMSLKHGNFIGKERFSDGDGSIQISGENLNFEKQEAKIIHNPGSAEEREEIVSFKELDEMLDKYPFNGPSSANNLSKPEIRDISADKIIEKEEKVSLVGKTAEFIEEKNPTENKQSEDEDLELIRQVEKSRVNYSRKKLQMDLNVSKFDNILGIKFGSDNVDSVSKSYELYENLLKQLLNNQIERLKNHNLSEDDLKKKTGELVRYFNIEEKCNLKQAELSQEDEEMMNFLKNSGKSIQGLGELFDSDVKNLNEDASQSEVSKKSLDIVRRIKLLVNPEETEDFSDLRGAIKKIEEEYENALGEEAKIKKGESLRFWSLRLAESSEKKIDSTKDNNKFLLEELGLGDLPEDQKENMLSKITETFSKVMFFKVMKKLSPVEQKEYQKLAQQEADFKKVEDFVKEKVTNYKQFLNREADNFKKDILSVN